VAEKIRRPSGSGSSERPGSAYEYLIQWPLGPTISRPTVGQYITWHPPPTSCRVVPCVSRVACRARRVGGGTTESAPHHSTWLGGTLEPVLNSDRLFEKSADTTHSVPARAAPTRQLSSVLGTRHWRKTTKKKTTTAKERCGGSTGFGEAGDQFAVARDGHAHERSVLQQLTTNKPNIDQETRCTMRVVSCRVVCRVSCVVCRVSCVVSARYGAVPDP